MRSTITYRCRTLYCRPRIPARACTRGAIAIVARVDGRRAVDLLGPNIDEEIDEQIWCGFGEPRTFSAHALCEGETLMSKLKHTLVAAIGTALACSAYEQQRRNPSSAGETVAGDGLSMSLEVVCCSCLRPVQSSPSDRRQTCGSGRTCKRRERQSKSVFRSTHDSLRIHWRPYDAREDVDRPMALYS
jgi:hypothetical protein